MKIVLFQMINEVIMFADADTHNPIQYRLTKPL